MSAQDRVKISGLLEHQLTAGTTTASAIKELIDNALDAGASRALLKIDTRTGKIYAVDDGVGMNRETAERAYYIHDNKVASAKIGLRGLGKSNSEAYLSHLATSTMTYTKSAGHELMEIVAPWAEGVATNTWRPVVSLPGRMSRLGEETWHTHKIADHGTVVEIPIHPDRLRDITTKLPALLADIASTYQFSGGSIKVIVDDEEQELPTTLNLGWGDVGSNNRHETELEVWKKGDETLVYHKEGGEFVRLDLAKTLAAARIKDYQAVCGAPGTEWRRIGTVFKLKTVFKPEWTPVNRKEEPGYYGFVRGGRMMFRLPTERPNSGSEDRRKIIAATRTVVFGNHTEDALVRPLGNKSSYTSETIDESLLRYVKRLHLRWADKYHKDHRSPDPEPDVPAPVAPDSPAAAGAGNPVVGDYAPLTRRERDQFLEYLEGDDEFRREARELLRRYLPE